MKKEDLQNAIYVAKRYFDINLTEKWIVDHIDRINTFFPQDRGYAFTFEGECERKTLSDTKPRESFLDAIAYVVIGKSWPILCEKSKIDSFFIEFKNAVSQQEGISLG